MFETGVGLKNPLFFIGCVENIIDRRREGRVQVRAFGVHGTNNEIPTENLPWATVVHGDYEPNKRLSLNDWVFGCFIDGREAQQPLILGLVPTQMAQAPDPENDGFGAIPSQDCEIQMQGNAATNAGQARQSRLHRAEEINDTYVPVQEMLRNEDIEGAKGGETWSEPPPAYNAEYPYNRVIETAKHSIEIDDTPGAERIMVRHNSGSYIQIDDRGSHTHKTTGDKFDVNDRNQYIHVKGASNVTIEGNAYVRVKGNKVEEIDGNLEHLVHGNYMLSVGGESNINASELCNIRGADVRVNANVGTLSLKAKKEMAIQAGGKWPGPILSEVPGAEPYGTISIKAEKILTDAVDKLHMRGNTQVNIQAIQEMNLSSINMYNYSISNESYAAGNHTITSGIASHFTSSIATYMTGGSQLHLKAGSTYIDDIVNIGSSVTVPGTPSTIAPNLLIPPVPKALVPVSPIPEIAEFAPDAEMPPPVEKRTAVVTKDRPAAFSEGILGGDDKEDAGSP